MKETKSAKSRHRQYLAAVLAFVFILSAVLLFVSIWERSHGGSFIGGGDNLSSTLQYQGETYVKKDNIETVLIMGLDKYSGTVDESYNNDKQADFLLLLVIDNDNHKYTAVHINRDTMTNVHKLGVGGGDAGSSIKQIALAYNQGNGGLTSCRNTGDSVSELMMGIKIDHYIAVTMDSVAIFNDLVGGVEVTVLDDFTGVDDTLIKGEKVTLMGEHALNYVRTRKGLSDSTNETRMERQRQYLKALHKKTVELAHTDDEFIVDATLKMGDYLVSDYSVTRLQEVFERISSYSFAELRYFEGENKIGTDAFGQQAVEFYPTEESIQKIVVDLFYRLEK
ncbi:MAG: LCP family protein [Clostridia bacterium]|nr:LCP family protein [Clostridia bacterium]